MNQMLKENKNKQAPSQPWDVAQLIEYWDSMSKALGLVYPYKLSVAIHASNPRACQMEAERPGVQAFKLILNHIASSSPAMWTPVSNKQQQKR